MKRVSDSSGDDVVAVLQRKGMLDPDQVRQVRLRQDRLKVPAYKAILDLNLATETETLEALAEHLGLEFQALGDFTIAREMIEIIPLRLIFHYRFLPIGIDQNRLTLAFGEPPDSMELGNLQLLLKHPLRVVLTTPSRVHAVLKNQFGLGAVTVQKLQEDSPVGAGESETVFDIAEDRLRAASDATIADLVDQLIGEALRVRATDIHLEPYAGTVRLRYRIDGLLQMIPLPAELRRYYGAIVSRLKIMAELDIAEKRLPHDGRITMTTGGASFDLRLSTLPTPHGEAVCLRVLGQESLFLSLGQLGMEPDQEKLFRQILYAPQGMVLITGPTGSGKTTTLYAALAESNDEARKVITIEDPIEYQLPGIAQIQTRQEIGLTFATGLRSLLRHDPDVVLVGEIRDPETAAIAVSAAQTGHLVFSTLHTNDSVSAVLRLRQMKVDGFLVGASLMCVVAQRLVRKVCKHCAIADDSLPASLRREIASTLQIDDRDVLTYRGEGCVECQQRGSKGRMAVYEFFVGNDEIAEAIAAGASLTKLRALARASGWRSLREMAMVKVQRGRVSWRELQRATWRLNSN